MKITTKFIIWFLIISLVPLAISIYISYNRSRQVLEEEVAKSLMAVADNKANQIEAHLRSQKENAITLSYYSEVISALARFIEVANKAGIDSLEYRSAEQEFKPMLGYYQRLFEYDDIFFVSPENSVVFSTAGIKDINSIYGIASYTDSELNKVLNQARLFQETALSNLQYYPEAKKAAIFIATPIFEGLDLLGYVVVQIGTKGILGFVKDYTGLGETGETIVVAKMGSKAVFIAPTRFDPEAAFIRKIAIGTSEGLDLQKALSGEKGLGVNINYRDQEVLSVWRPLPTFGLAMAVTMDTREVFASANKLKNTLFSISLALVLLVVVMAVLIAGSVSRPIKELTQTTKTISEGDLTARAEITGKDEIGELAHSFNQMTDKLVEAKANVEEQKRLLEAANKELDSFVYTVSHDLRAPLRGVDGLVKFLEEDYANKLDEQGKEYLKKIRSGANHMKALIDDLLTLSRISRIKNPFEEVNMKDLVDSVVGRIEFDIKQQNVDLKISENLPVLRCDKIKIAEVFLNLINNAIKFSPKKKDSQPRVEVGYNYDREKAEHVFFVKDNGIGIDKKYHSEIFGIFKRLHNQDEYEGTGAGLSIVKKIIEDHNGSVWIDSEPGQGATFYFSISEKIEQPKKIGQLLVESGAASQEEVREKL
ncbi:MAG: hypothetical protein DRP74_03295 [Candidatus Omnitrophota bacterium]|nr:MAG: hypothetical protein DRP74_03295 [Candidatus Omnitrophota bacterium]